MSQFDEYAYKYDNIRMERQNGILQITLHTDGDTLRWTGGGQRNFPQAFRDIGSDRENKVVIMTGAGDAFVDVGGHSGPGPKMTASEWDKSYFDVKHRLMSLLDIEVPMISGVNGPAVAHGELPLLCDIVLAAEEASFGDTYHFKSGSLPGDGVQIVYPLLLGLNRGRYFLLTGQTLSAREAKELGLVNEVMPRQELLPRAWALAEELAQKPSLVLRYSRVVFTHQLKRMMQEMLGYGMALYGLSQMDASSEGD